MIDLEAQLRRIDAELCAIGAAFAVVGGLAVSVRAEPRLTRDADLAVAVNSDDEAEAVIRALSVRGYRVVALVEQEATGRLATVRLGHGPMDGVVVDLLFASCGIEREIVAAAEQVAVVSGFVLPVASVGHLIAMKLLARDDRARPLDADDLRSLRAIAQHKDWTVASDAVALIVERGYARGRDLRTALEALRADGAY
ncbi:MAG: nucleotidyl transferase AbiEii/AbiGii toxin family protein [Acidimicrobiales bacterium]